MAEQPSTKVTLAQVKQAIQERDTAEAYWQTVAREANKLFDDWYGQTARETCCPGYGEKCREEREAYTSFLQAKERVEILCITYCEQLVDGEE